MKNASYRSLKNFLIAAAVVTASSGYSAIQSDLLCSYPPSTASAWGGEANAQVNMANGVIGSNGLNDQSGTGESFNIVGYFMSSRDSSGEDNSGVLGLVAGDSSYSDVRNYAASVGADQVIYVPYASTGAAGNAYQPGTYATISSTWWWLVVLAHESGGHNYGCAHGDDHLSPKGIMMHNYCGGGAAYPYFYGNPNIWQGGVNLLGDGISCLGGSLISGGDNAYRISSSAQGMCDTTLRVVYAPVFNSTIYHWSFTNSAASAPAGTTNYDLVSGAPAVVRGNGATYTGSALRIPGGTTGNVAMNSMSAYIDLPNGIISSQTSVTIEIWATPLSAPNWARIFDFGRTTEAGDGLGATGEFTGDPSDPAPGSTSSYSDIMLSASIGTDITQQRFEAKLNGTAVTLNTALATTAGVQHHYAATFTDGAGTYGSGGGRWQWYRDGFTVGFLDVNYHLSSLPDVNNWLGRSMWSGDSNGNCDYSEVRISSVAMNLFQVRANYLAGPNYAPRSATMTYSDLYNGGTRSFNTAGYWSDGLAPSAGKSYDASDFNLTTPNDAVPHTFAGDSLRASGGIFFYNATGNSIITVNNFLIDNEEIVNSSSGKTFTLAGNLYVTNNNIIRGAGAPINVSANLSGNGSITLHANTATLTGNNANFTGKIRVGNGMTGALSLSSEAQLGANPPSFTADQFIFNRGWLYTTTSFTISNSNRGITIGANDGIFDESSGTTLTLSCPLASGYQTISGNQLTTVGQIGGVVAGVLIKQNSGTLALTSSNPNYNGAISINAGTLSLAGAGQLGGGSFGNPFTDSGIFDYSSSAVQTISSAIAGTGAITKNGNGTLTLSGANTLSGAVTVNSGTLYANPANAANNRAFSYVSGITVNNGGTLQSGPNGLFGWDGTQEKSITVNSGGMLTCDSGADVGVGTVTLAGGTMSNLGASTAYGSWRFDDATDKLVVTADSTLNAVNVKFGNPAAHIEVAAGKTLSITGTITDASSGGTSSLTTLNSPGTVVLSGVNTYTGITTIGAGRLNLTNTASLTSSNIATAVGATFDVSGVTSTFTVKANQMLGGSGTNVGVVTTVSGAKVSAGTDGGYGTNRFTTDVTVVAGAYLCFDLGSSATGANDKIIFGGNLNLNTTTFRFKGPANLDPTADYLLATVSGTLSGSVNPTPIWDVQPGNSGAFSVIVTNGNQIVLHAVSLPPTFTSASASPASLGRNQLLFLSAAGAAGTYPISNYTANATSIGGPAVLTLVADGGGNFTNSVAVSAATAIGAGKSISVTLTDSNNISSITNFTVTIVATNRTWNGAGSDNNWSSNPNWSTSAGPGFVGDAVVFGGGTRPAPFMETNYSVTGVTFDNTAGSFTVGTSGKFLTLTGSGITNNSTTSQILNVPLSMSIAQTFNAAAGNLTLGQNITNNGNLVTMSGASNTVVSGGISGSAGLLKSGTGTATLAGTSSYTGTTTISAGTLNVSGTLPSTNITYVGSVVGKAALTVSGALSQKNLLIGNLSGATGAVYQTSGTITVTNGGGDGLNVGNVSGGYGYYNISGGTTLANGLVVGGENNDGTGFSGTGGNGLMDVQGGTVNDVGWLVMSRGAAAETGVLNIFGGNLNYAGGGIINCWGTGQTAIINVLGGVVSNSIAVGFNLNQSGNAANTGILNLNGGVAQATGFSGSTGARVGFNGGTLKASAANGSFMAGLGSATVYSGGATINDNGFAIGVSQALLAPTGNGVNGIASFTAGAGYIAAPIVTVNRGGADTTGVGATAVAQIDRIAGTVTNVIITCPGVNYTATPTFTLSGGGASTPATITGQAPTANTSGGFTKTGGGTLALGNPSTYSGNTTISGGTLRLGDAVLHMTFDSVNGTTVTNAGSGGAAMNGTLTGTATIVAGGRVGKALSIPAGTSSAAYVLVNSSVVSFNASNSWSMGMWIQTSTAGATYLYQGDGTWGSGNTTFYLNNGSGAGTKAGGVRYAQGWESGTANINDGAWHFIALTDANGIRTMYVDGVVDSITVNAWNGNGVGGQLRIGGNGTGEADGQVALGGLIDEVYIYNRALSQAEVQSLYAKNFSGASVLPVATAVSVPTGTTLAVGGISQTIGSLTGSGSVILGDDAASLGNFTVGNASSTTFSGIISDAAFTPVTKAGAGALTLAGTNTYRGTTTVSNGTLLVNGALGTNTLTVVSGTLGGSGVIAGAVTVQSGGTLSPGNSAGKLTVSNNVTLLAGSTTLMEISKAPQTNDQLRVTGTLTFAGTLVVTNLSGTPAANDSFQLFNAGSIAGTFSATNLPSLNAGLGWNFNSASGVLSVVQTVATNTTDIAFSAGGGNLTLSWPLDHTGWRLQVQTNNLTTGLSANWFDVPGSTTTNNVVLPVDSTLGNVFYRLIYP